MNPLAALKEKLMIKPNVEERERVAVVIKGVKKRTKSEAPKKIPKKEKEEGEVSEEEVSEEVVENVNKSKIEETRADAKQFGPLIVDETQRGFDRNELLKKLAENKKLKVTLQPVLKISEEGRVSEPIPLQASTSKVKKLDISRPLILNEDINEDSDSCN